MYICQLKNKSKAEYYEECICKQIKTSTYNARFFYGTIM